MSPFWNDPHRRELIVAAVAGAAWALFGAALAARGDAGAAQVRIHNALGNGSANVGSGTLVDVAADRRNGLVLSCAHLFTEGEGRVVVEFANGRTHGANVIAMDRDADLAALEIANPQERAVPISFTIDGASQLTACGFGPSGQFRCVAGPIVGVAQGSGQESVKIAGAVRSGDSGGGVFDPAGRLVGVVWGESGGVTYASSGGPFRRFLERVLGRRSPAGISAGVAGLPRGEPVATICPDGRCPLIAPGTIFNPPGDLTPALDSGLLGGNRSPVGADCQGACAEQLAAIAARIAALETGKQDRGDYLGRGELASYARADQLNLFEQRSSQRHDSLLERLELLGPIVGVAGRAALPMAVTSLGISGPIGWGILLAATVGGGLIGRRLRQMGRRRGSRNVSAATSDALVPRPSLRVSHEEAAADADHVFRESSARTETHQPIERDDREARELLRLSQFEGRDPLQDAVAGRIALDRLDAAADGDADPHHARWADELRRELRERFNDIAPTKFQINGEGGMGNGE